MKWLRCRKCPFWIKPENQAIVISLNNKDVACFCRHCMPDEPKVDKTSDLSDKKALR